MNNPQFDEFLEALAELIEAKAKTVEEAAQIVRDHKVSKGKKKKPVTTPNKSK